MADLTEANDINNNYDERKCPSCKMLYKEDNNIPRILLNCGHTICSNCILNSINSSKVLKCPEDSTEYENISSLDSFPINKALIKLLHKIADNKKQKENTKNLINIKNNFPTSSPSGSPSKGLNTARTSRQSLETLKLTSLSGSKKSTKCNEHPNRKLEMICLEEVCKICTNCAIFGRHKNHNVINIDEFIKDIECKAEKLIELFENISDGSIKKDLDIINEKSKDKLSTLLELINHKYNNMENVIHEFTQNLIEKVKKDENILLGEISSQFDKLKRRISYYLELPNKINNNIKDWKEKVQDKMNILNTVKDISDECLKFVDCYGDNLFNKLIKTGNGIVSDVQKIISFPNDEIQEDIKNLNLTIEKQILNQEFFHINNKLDFGDLCEKYEIPKKEESSNQSSISKDKNKIVLKEVTQFENREISDEDKNNKASNYINKMGGEIACDEINLKQLNNITQDSENGNAHPIDKAADEKLNLFLQKEMEIENIQFGDDSFLFTDLDLIGLDLDVKNKNKKKDEQHSKNIKNIKPINPLNLNDNKLEQETSDLKTLKPRKSLDNFNLITHRNSTAYDRDSFDITLKKTPLKSKKIIKKTKSNIDFHRSPYSNKRKSKDKHNHKLSKDTKSLRPLSPFEYNKYSLLKNLLKKSDKINLSRKELSEEVVIGLAEQIKKNKDKVKEIKLIKCGINDNGAIHLLKAMEVCQKLSSINIANNLLSDKIVNNVINLLNKNYSIMSCYFTNNNFSVISKGKIKSYNRNGKLKIFV